MDIYTIIGSTIMALLGSITHTLMWIKSWEELTKFENVRTILLGIIVGFLYGVLRVEHGFPDSVMSFVVGYTAKDFLDWLVEKFKPYREKVEVEVE